MPGTGSYINGSASANYFNTVGELLTQLPDNTANLIVASDIRDSVWTLWNRIDDVSLISASAASASVFYTNPSVTPVTVGGIPAGSSFSSTYTMQQMFDKLLYPYISQACSISSITSREFGDTSLVIPLNWSVTKNSNSITSIIVNGSPVVPTGNNQSGVGSGTIVQNVNTSFSISTNDGTSVVSATTTVTWYNARYWGTSVSFGALTSGQILSLSGAGVGVGKELSTTRVQTRNGISGAGNYLVFAWPSSFGTPFFIINGLPNTAFTKVNNAFSFTNTYGYITNYDVWMSNTPQNSPISLFQIN